MKSLLQNHCELRLNDGTRAIGLLVHFGNGLVGLANAAIDGKNDSDSGDLIYFPLTSISWIRPIQAGASPSTAE